MNRLLLITTLTGFFAVSMLTLGGCKDEGTAEKAGEQVDEAANDAADKVDDAADKTSDAIDSALDK